MNAQFHPITDPPTMISVLVINGDLGGLVADALNANTGKFRVHRTDLRNAEVERFAVDLTVIDRSVGDGRRWALVRAQGAPIFVIGEDIDMPFDVPTLVRAITEAAAHRGRETEDELIAIDPPLRTALRVVDQAARRRSGVLITGPTGVGKELLARRLHVASRRKGPLVAINCAALPLTLVDSALFGHVRGAFTGAASSTKGAFLEADHGTLFLDEIGDLDVSVQGKLLRAIEQGMIRPLGAAKDMAVDVRVVAATNRLLERDMALKRFRSDLYYRVATFRIAVPPLRVRPRDLGALIERFHARHERGAVVSLSSEARHVLEHYAWPGNVRELGNVLERVLSLAPSGALSAAMLIEIAPELAGAGEIAASAREGRVRAHTSIRKALSVDEDQVIRASLTSGNSDRQQLAETLGIHRSTLWRKMKRIMISDEPAPPTTSPGEGRLALDRRKI